MNTPPPPAPTDIEAGEAGKFLNPVLGDNEIWAATAPPVAELPMLGAHMSALMTWRGEEPAKAGELHCEPREVAGTAMHPSCLSGLMSTAFWTMPPALGDIRPRFVPLTGVPTTVNPIVCG